MAIKYILLEEIYRETPPIRSCDLCGQCKRYGKEIEKEIETSQLSIVQYWRKGIN